jgi:chromosome partitioning protein
MRVVAVLNQKGGSGKTTIATNLARAMQLRGLAVCLIDADPQGTAAEWAARRDETPPVYSAHKPTIHKDLPALSASFDACVIDGAPAIADLATSAVKAAGLVLVPVRPSAPDIWAAGDIIDVVRARQKATGGPDVAFVVSQQVPRSNLASSVEDALGSYDVDVLPSRTSSRVAYAEALGAGLSVLDTSSPKAAAEIRALTTDVLSRIGLDD